jgi:hypothetical protein
MSTPTFHHYNVAFCGLFLLICALVAQSVPRSQATATDFKVFEIVFDPIIEAQGGARLTQLKGWAEPSNIDTQYITDIRTASHNYVQYSLQRVVVDAIPPKKDGFHYTDSSYLQCLQNTTTCHMPDTVDYGKIFQDYAICDKVLNQGISEVWLWGGPYFGYWEYNVRGPRIAITPENIPQCGDKTLFVMGFNYERGLTEMLHNFGHRAEGILAQVIARGIWQQNEANDWNSFSLVAAPVSSAPYGHCGNVHYPPNGLSDYDYGNQRFVSSDCDDWLNYPNRTNTYKTINCEEWGCSGHGYHWWWLYRLPHAAGTTNGYLNDWWRYVVDYDNATLEAARTPTPSQASAPTRTATATALATSTVTPQPTKQAPPQYHLLLPLL